MKILLFGEQGQLGQELQRSLSPLGDIVALHAGSKPFCGDLNDLAGISSAVLSIRPDVVVNAAAWTNVDLAETEPAMVWKVNALAPAALAKAASVIGALMVHYSSDYVFDGKSKLPWTEVDTPRPLNVYGRSKLEADQLVASNCANHLIFRTSWMYSAVGRNFVTTILAKAEAHTDLAVVADQTGAPTGADWVADMTAHAIADAIGGSEVQGLYNLAAAGQTSWHAYACFVIDSARRAGWELKATPAAVKALTSDELRTVAERPKNSVLDTRKFQSVFRTVPPDWRDGVKRMIARLK
ncbi:MAG: dTDP-4-dehydrorhamnose reductase [Polaromonas sp.]|nr:dTDP-4-dehydrorhamnose reductase [Polaromonas sp.]